MPSAYKILQQSLANPVKMVPVGYVQNARYGTPNFDMVAFARQFLSWQNSSNYSQKWRHNDMSAMQFHRSANMNVNLQLVDCNGIVWKDYAATRIYENFSGNTVIRDGVEFPLYTATFTISFDSIPDGTYYLLLSVDYDVATGVTETETYLSEPQFVSDTLENTIILEYTNNKIAFQTYFGNYHFKMRVEGSIDYITPESVDTQYSDEYMNLRMLNSYPFRKFQLNIGGVIGVPAYIIDKIYIALGCSSLKIDSSFYTKGEGAKISLLQGDSRMYGQIEMREANNYFDTTFVKRSGIVILIVPTTDFAVRNISIGGNTYYIDQLVAANNVSAFIFYLNNVFKYLTTPNLLGHFEQQGSNIVYIQDDTETYTTASSIVLPKVVYANHNALNITGPLFDLNIEMRYAVVDWGDGSPATGTGTGSDINVHLTHKYMNPIGKVLKIYHDDSFILLTLNEPSLTAVGGDFGIGFQAIALLSGNLGYFEFGDVDKAKATLLSIILNNCNITDIDNLSSNYPLIQRIDLKNNKLSRGTTNAIVVNTDTVAQSTPSMQSGQHTLALQGQNPPAPLYSTGSFSANHLRNSYSWTVTTD